MQGAVRSHADAGSAPAVHHQALDHRSLRHRGEPQMAFTRNAPPDGMQNIIWAFSRTPPGSDDPGAPISIHHKIGRGMLNLTRITDIPAGPPVPVPPPPPVHFEHPHLHPADEGDHDDDEKAEDDDDDDVDGGSASFVHGALCTAGFLLVLPSGALVARYAQATGSPRAFLLHRLLQFGVAIVGGTLAYLFRDSHGSSMAHKVGGVGLVLLYVVQCAIGSRVHRIPEESRTGAHGALLAGLGSAIVLLAFSRRGSASSRPAGPHSCGLHCYSPSLPRTLSA
ncbi:hypothetical protein EDB84DRAFT_339283 [Lactarius hengduanensis]|nr:hypothetical protein EDB84DRAFT_339283 [Lactarius hengduanensis]